MKKIIKQYCNAYGINYKINNKRKINNLILKFNIKNYNPDKITSNK